MVAVVAPATAYDQYVEDVLSGDKVVCKWVRLAAERHVRDLEHGHERGLYFDRDAAEVALGFFKLLHHSKGKWAGQPLVLEPWQEFGIACVFGWKNADGTRRFRTVYEEVPRKNGKSTKLSGVALKCMIADGEAGAEVYTAATKKDQARIVWNESARMVESSPALKKRITIYRDNLHVKGTATKYEPLGRDRDTMDGLNTHCVVIDELHAHRTREVYDVLDTSTGSREQPLIYSITTAGYDRHSICWELHEYTEKILEGVVDDDSFFGIIYTIDEGDDWQDPAIWEKANPNYGISVNPDDLARKARKALEMPSAQNAFMRLHLNVWTEQQDRWLSIEVWDENAGEVDPTELYGRRCYGGLDLSKTRDVSALVLVFPPDDSAEPWRVLCWFWIPEESITERSRRDRVPYDVWRDAGLLKATEGNVVDYDVLEADITEVASNYDLVECAYDRMYSGAIVQHLTAEGLVMVPFGQGFLSMAQPTADLERLVVGRQLAHAGHPVLRWMASNVAVEQDPAGNMKPSKLKSREKIDGIVALIMAIGRATLSVGESGSPWDEEGLFTL